MGWTLRMQAVMIHLMVRLQELEQLLRRQQVEQATGLCRSALYRMVAQGKFPPPIRVGSRTVAWVASEVQAWIHGRIVATRGQSVVAVENGKGA